MKKIFYLAACLFPVCSTYAQQPTPGPARQAISAAPQAPKGNGRISGTVTDAESGQPVEFATITLLPKTGEKPLDGTICNAKGQFELKNLAAGAYRLQVSFIGYENKIVEEVNLAGNYSEANLGNLTLQSDTKRLAEVSVTAERDLIENKIDRMVYNAEKDAGNRGGTAADVLKKVPQVTVDLDGNVQLRGSSNIRVLINNKPSSIMAGSIADAMKQIPSDIIKSVEVITSPSAKYDAEGTAGIINIITKKTDIEGLSGNANISLGTLTSNVGGSVNKRSGKLGLNTSIGNNFWGINAKTRVNRTDELPNQTNDLVQRSSFHNGGDFKYAQFGMDYDFSEKNSMNAGVRLNQSLFRNQNELFSSYAQNGLPVLEYNRDIDTKNYSKGVDMNMGFTHVYKPQHELSLLGLYTRNPRETLYDLDQFNLDGDRNYREKNTNNNTNEEITFQADYTQPFKNNQVLETGAKGILRNVFSDYRFFNDPTGNGDFISRPDRSDLFEYDQNVAAAYASYGFKLGKKYNFKLGGRYEHTFINADFSSTETKFATDYHNFIPNLMAAYDLKENQKLKISYTRRIQRPLIFYLNPFVNTSDPLNISYGNPNLEPELTDAYELGYNTFFKKGSVNAALYWRQTNNAIETVRFLDEKNVVNTTFRNIAENTTIGLSLFGSLKPIEKLSLSGNANFFYTRLHSNQSLELLTLQTTNSNVQANFNLNGSWQFKEGWAVEAFGFYNTPRVQLQGKTSGMRYYNFALKKDIMQKKGSLSVGLDNVFEKSTMVRTTYETATTDNTTEMRFFRRGIRVSFNYQFGKMQFNSPRKKAIRNDDVKGGDGNGGQ
jgi:outer membrane receptor protein involved in Fe transport